MAGKYGAASVAITLDDGPGGVSRDITAYVQEISGVRREAITEQSNPFGVAYQAHTPTGVVQVLDITLSGIFDTTATTGPHVVLGAPDDGPQDATRTFTFGPGDSKTFTMECRLVSYEVRAVANNLSRFAAVIRQAGDGAWS